ncbi:MAG: PepSY domain-containing protein [Thermoanaerobaculia bacterium]|nr:PepSY domain-containing protein [Thermoanaerobaculia bacterium]
MRLALLSAFALFALPAVAADRCDVPKANWRSKEDLQAQLVAKGWSISNIKTDDGCYEVYGKDADGKRVEIYFDPASFEAVGSDD